MSTVEQSFSIVDFRLGSIWVLQVVKLSTNLYRPKTGGNFAPPLRHIIKKSTVVGSRVDGSDHPQILFMRDPVRLCGTHMRDQCGFKWYSCGTHIRWDPHILVCGTHNSIEWDSWFCPTIAPHHQEMHGRRITRWCLLTVKIRQPSHKFTFGVGISFILYPLVLTPVV
jgi:hypothetical protein